MYEDEPLTRVLVPVRLTNLGVGPAVEVLGASAAARLAHGAVRVALVVAAREAVARPLVDQHVLEGEGQETAPELGVLLLERHHVGLHRSSVVRREKAATGFAKHQKEKGTVVRSTSDQENAVYTYVVKGIWMQCDHPLRPGVSRVGAH